MQTKVGKALGAVAFAAAAWLVAVPASAQTISYAQMSGGQYACPSGSTTPYPMIGNYLDAVFVAIDNGAYSGKNKLTDEQNLKDKLKAAYDKVSQKKWADAVSKLQDIENTVNALAGASKPKLSKDSAAAIDSAADAAIACLTP